MAENNEANLSVSDGDSIGIEDEKKVEANIMVNDQKEVMLKASGSEGDEHDSIDATPQNKFPINSAKDPDILLVQDKSTTHESQSKCCLLL